MNPNESPSDDYLDQLRQLPPAEMHVDQRELFYRAGYAAAKQELAQQAGAIANSETVHSTAKKSQWLSIALAASLAALLAVPLGMKIGQQASAPVMAELSSENTLSSQETRSGNLGSKPSATAGDHDTAEIETDSVPSIRDPRDLVTPRKDRTSHLIFDSQLQRPMTLAAYHGASLDEFDLQQSISIHSLAASVSSSNDLEDDLPPTLAVGDTLNALLPQ
ncbi:hypothetical protein [Planctomycetes bacterium K23_9]|uniref:Uncharacterized protein n=1 Tax=Stieleria marina TaxID=1930275 RepID=A0A517NXP2_9BACT|nr:hypothetical protein K239x_38710 [Planctomycetes bacterium K23_9]